MTLRAISVLRAGEAHETAGARPFAIAVLARDERHVRRKTIVLKHGDKILIDLAEATVLADGDVLVLEDGRGVGIVAAEEALYAISGRDAVHLAELAWHIGNRHLPAQIEAGRILIERDHVIRAMLTGLGATVVDCTEPFNAMRGAYSGGHSHHDHAGAGHAGDDSHHHDHGDHDHGHHHDHHHGEHGHRHD